jgi:hypothetical protein
VVEALSSAVVALRDASVLEAVKEGQRRTRQARVSNFEAAVRYYLTVVAGPVHFAKVPLCWMGDWREDWPEWVVVHLGEGSLETAGGSLNWLAEHRHYTSVEAAVRLEQVGRTNSAVTAAAATLVPAAALASELTESLMMLSEVA